MTMPDRQRWMQLSPLLDELLDLGAASRRGRLAELRLLDGSIADELDAMLRAAGHAEQVNFLAGAVHPDGASAATLVGRQVGAYIIEAPLGEGGTGSVWRAARADGRFEGAVAIKLLHLSLVGRIGALRFEREGTILSRLTHPHIARLLDAGVTADGQPYLVLELVEGQRIDAYCNARRLSVDQRLKLFNDVAAAVAHAHSHLVIHRDIKPSNILVSTEGSVKLLDFGIAKLLEGDADGALVTAEGHRALTPEFAAPEQLHGAPVTTATDVYALGVLLYLLLVGRHPTAPVGASSAEVMRGTLDTEPWRVTSALAAPVGRDSDAPTRTAADRNTSLARLRRQLEGDLENILAKTLRKNPEQRYQTVGALAEDLRRYRASEPVSARPDSVTYRSAKFLRRYRVTVTAGVVVMLAIAAGPAGTVSQARRAEVQALRAEHERDRAQHELSGAEAMEEFLTFLLTSKADKPFTTSELLLRGETLAREQFADDAALRARLLLTLSNLTSELDEQDRTIALLREAQTAVNHTGETALKAAIDCSVASDLAAEPDQAKASALFDAALERVATGPDGEDRASRSNCLYLRATRALEAGDAPAAVRDSRAALEVLGAPRPGQRTMALAMRMNLAGALAKSGEQAEGIAELKRGIAELNAMGRGHTVGAVTFQNNLGVLLAGAGDTLGALQAYQEALAIQGDTTISARLWMNLAHQLLAVGRQREATEYFERGRALATQRGDVRVLAYGTVDFNYCAAGQAARCARRLAEARQILTGLLPPRHSTFGNLETTTAELALARGEIKPARDALLRALAIFDSQPTPQPMRTRAAALLARAELAGGDLEAAASHAAQAQAQARALAKGFAHSQWLGTAAVAQGLVQRARGDSAAAQASWRAALAELQATVGDLGPETTEVRRLLGVS